MNADERGSDPCFSESGRILVLKKFRHRVPVFIRLRMKFMNNAD